MSSFLQLTPHDPLIARDGRPFGAGQGHRMRGMAWPLPSVVAGSFRTALVKGMAGLDFSGDMPRRLLEIGVAGVFPVSATNGQSPQIYLPAPSDAVATPSDAVATPNDGSVKSIVHRAVPQNMEELGGGCDFPSPGLQPVMLPESTGSFKPGKMPAWWPLEQYAQWLVGQDVSFDSTFLNSPIEEIRDHVALDAERGASNDGEIFSTTGLNVTHMPRFRLDQSDSVYSFNDRFAEVTLSARVDIPDSEAELKIGENFRMWHPLGGERRLIHWDHQGDKGLWRCPEIVSKGLETATGIRMVLATPAIFKHGWRPDWLNDQLEGTPPGSNVRLKLVGVNNGRWRAVSGWSLAETKSQPRGPKPIRRMTPAGSVYFFQCEKPGDAATLTQQWLKSVSDDQQERLDGFGLAVWGTWCDSSFTKR